MSFYTNGFLRKTPSGKWAGVLKWRDPEGTWRQVTRTFTADRDEAVRQMTEWRALMEAGASPDVAGPAATAGPTVEEAVRSMLAAQLARRRIERSTHDTQIAYSERSLFPELGAVPLAALTTKRVQSWVDGLCLRMSPGAASIPYAVLAKTLVSAERSGALPHNPLVGVDPPRRPQPSRACLTETSVSLLEGALDSQWGAASGMSLAVHLALYAGLRAGECCALRWRDVSEDRTRLRVAASIGRSAEGCYVKGPKNPSSAREMPVIPALSAALAKRASSLGSAPEGAWFCCGEEEAFLDPHRLSRKFSELCGAAGVTNNTGDRATFHELRHTFATRAVRAGVDVRALADLMGHARADITLNVYAGSGEDAKLAAVRRMSGLAKPQGKRA